MAEKRLASFFRSIGPLSVPPKNARRLDAFVSIMSTDRLAADLVRADDISWTSDALPRLEWLPAAALLALGPGEPLEYEPGGVTRVREQRTQALDQAQSKRPRSVKAAR